jgi:hypothetical protein
MKTFPRRRPSASLIISILALVIAMSGTAIAAGSLAAGDNVIKRNSLSGNRLRNHTLTARQLDLKLIGTMPNAVNAQSAQSALTAVNATNATDALTATQAGSLDGRQAAGTAGIVTAAASPAGNTVPLFSSGPFTVTMTCTQSGSVTEATLTATSSLANSVFNETVEPDAGAPVHIGLPVTSTSSPSIKSGLAMYLEAPGGAAVEVTGSVGVDSLGVACWSDFTGLT